MSRIRRVLHPTDFSRASTAAFKRAVEMAKGNRAELLLVHVMVPAVPLMGDGYVSPKVYEDLEAFWWEDATPQGGRVGHLHRDAIKAQGHVVAHKAIPEDFPK